jgi:hypothetical protein
MTAVMKYAGALSLDDLETEVRRAFDPSNSASQTRKRSGATSTSMPAQPHATDASAVRAARLGRPYEPLLRFAVINLAGFALLGAAWTQGWIETVLAADGTGLTLMICAVFAAGLAICGAKMFRLGREIEGLRAGSARPLSFAGGYLSAIDGRDASSRGIAASLLRLRLGDWIAVVRHVANSLVLLGLIGTVIGFIISLSGVDPNAVSDIKAISPMVSKLLSGMSVALYTTLAGATLNLWLMVNHRLLSGAASRFVASLVEKGEADVRA